MKTGCPPDPLPVCEDCADPVPEGEGCRHNGRVWCASCFVERCAECVADLRDAAAESSRGER